MLVKRQKFRFFIFIIFVFSASCTLEKSEKWVPMADWGHWRLGHRSDKDFLEKNKMTVTFGSGAPNFEYVSRVEFDNSMIEAKAFNDEYHQDGYIVLRYLSTSLNGETQNSQDIPKESEIDFLDFYNDNWSEFEDYIGPKPTLDPKSWITRRPDNTFPFYRYAPYGRTPDEGFETWGCPNNPDYIKMMKGRIRAQAETGIDGSYVDWTQIAGGTCYCAHCSEEFKNYLKINLPVETAKNKYLNHDYSTIVPPTAFGQDYWMEWLRFRGYTVAKFHKTLRAEAREVNPHFMISGNVFGGFGFGPIAYDAAGNMEMLGREGYDDFIYSEMQEYLDNAPRKNKDGIRITNSPGIKFLAAVSHGKPVIVYATEITKPIFPDTSLSTLSLMSQINIAEAVANHAIFREKRETPPGATEFYNFLSTNESHLLGAHLTSDIAILASINQYLANELSFAFTTSRVLSDYGLNHVMIVEDDLILEDLSKYRIIIIPYLPLLNYDKQKILTDYINNGGNVIIMGESGIKDEWNDVNQDVRFTHLFTKNEYPDKLSIKRYGNGLVCYIPVPTDEHKYLVKTIDSENVTTFGPSMADVFPDIPEAYTRGNIHPELKSILNKLVDLLIEITSDGLTQIVNSKSLVELSTMDNKRNELLFHLVNYDVTLLGELSVKNNLKVQIRVPNDRKILNITYSGELDELKPIDFKTRLYKGEKLVQIELPKTEIYGFGIIEYSDVTE